MSNPAMQEIIRLAFQSTPIAIVSSALRRVKRCLESGDLIGCVSNHCLKIVRIPGRCRQWNDSGQIRWFNDAHFSTNRARVVRSSRPAFARL